MKLIVFLIMLSLICTFVYASELDDILGTIKMTEDQEERALLSTRFARICSFIIDLDKLQEIIDYLLSIDDKESSAPCIAMMSRFEHRVLEAMELMQDIYPVYLKYKSREIIGEWRLNSMVIRKGNDDMLTAIEEAKIALTESNDFFVQTEGRVALIRLYLNIGDVDSATKYYEDLTKIIKQPSIPHFPKILCEYGIAIYLYAINQYEEVTPLLESIVNNTTGYPKNTARFMLGNIKLKSGDAEGLSLMYDAIKYFEGVQRHQYMYIPYVLQSIEHLKKLALDDEAITLLAYITKVWHKHVLTEVKNRLDSEREYLQGLLKIQEQRNLILIIILVVSGFIIISAAGIIVYSIKQNQKLGKSNKALTTRTDQLQAVTFSTRHDLQGSMHDLQWGIETLNEDIPIEEIERLELKGTLELLNDGITKQIAVIGGLDSWLKACIEGKSEDSEVPLGHIVHPHDDGYVTIIGDFPVVKANKGQLIALVDNLVGNAMKHVIDPRIKIFMRNNSLVIEDNGGLFPIEQEAKMFAPFQRGNLEVEGTGMGLAIVKGIVDNMGWTIVVEVEQHIFTRFIIGGFRL